MGKSVYKPVYHLELNIIVSCLTQLHDYMLVYTNLNLWLLESYNVLHSEILHLQRQSIDLDLAQAMLHLGSLPIDLLCLRTMSMVR